MKVIVETKPLENVKAEALVVLHAGGVMLGGSENAGLQKHIDGFRRAVEKGNSKAEWFCTLDPDAGVEAGHLLLTSDTFAPEMPARERLKTIASRAIASCRHHSLTRIAVAVQGEDAAELAACVAEGIGLGDFRDLRFKGKPSPKPELKLSIVCTKEAEKAVKQSVSFTESLVDAANHARELVNAPFNILTPKALADDAAKVARGGSMKAEILDEKKILKKGYTLLHAVGRGSVNPPRMAVLRYSPKKKAIKSHVVLLGKGICNDTGGYSLKPKDSISRMSSDMAGAAAVVGIMMMVKELKLPIRVTAIIVAAHNAIDAVAYQPGEIIKTRNGKTVFVDNTDAEGRLVLADGLYRAGEEGADIIIDFATLTGAAHNALGSQIAALFTDDVDLRFALEEASEQSGEPVWSMPLWPEYEPSLRHEFADINNMSAMGQVGGCIHAANFMKAFVPEGTRWAHLDIAGPARCNSNSRYFSPGGTGYGVRLVTRMLMNAAEKGEI